MTNKKLLFVWNSLKTLAGVEVFMLTLASQLIKHNNQVGIIVFEEGDLRKDFEKLGVNVHLIKRRASFDMLAVFSIFSTIRRYHYDVIHSHEQFQSLVGALAGRLVGIRVISTFHIAFDEHQSIKKRQIIPWIISILSTKVTFVSIGVCESYTNALKNSKFLRKKYQVIYNGIPIEELRKKGNLINDEKNYFRKKMGVSGNEKLLLNVGRLTEQKGQINLLKAFTRLSKKNDNVKLCIVGDGELYNEFEAFINSNNLVDVISILPPTRAIHKLIAASDIFVFPSLWEGFSLILLEVMALGKPVIVSNATGVRELVDETNGIIVQKNCVNDLEMAIGNLINNSERQKILSRNARFKMQEFYSLERVYMQYEKIYS